MTDENKTYSFHGRLKPSPIVSILGAVESCLKGGLTPCPELMAMLAAPLDTGFSDCCGAPIHVGDLVQMEVECNEGVHGRWTLYRIELQGIVPKLSYIRSEKGYVLPFGYMAMWLTDAYDRKLGLDVNDPSVCRPSEPRFRVVTDEWVIDENSVEPMPTAKLEVDWEAFAEL